MKIGIKMKKKDETEVIVIPDVVVKKHQAKFLFQWNKTRKYIEIFKEHVDTENQKYFKLQTSYWNETTNHSYYSHNTSFEYSLIVELIFGENNG